MEKVTHKSRIPLQCVLCAVCCVRGLLVGGQYVWSRAVCLITSPHYTQILYATHLICSTAYKHTDRVGARPLLSSCICFLIILKFN